VTLDTPTYPQQWPPVAVVILNWNGADMLRRFLPGVLVTDYPRLEVVVADNASTDDSLDILRRQFPGVRVLRLDRNYGFAEGYNRAMAHIEAPVAVLLNSDVNVPANWLKPLVARLLSHDRMAAVQPKILAQARPSHFEYAGASGGFLDRLGYAFCRGRILHHAEADTGQYNAPMPVFWASGAALAIRTAVIQEVGLFDAHYFAHYEESDFCWRLHRAGYQVWCEPRAVVYHVGGGSLPQGSPFKMRLNFRNSLFTLWKNLPEQDRAEAIRMRLLLDHAAALREVMRRNWAAARAILQAHEEFFQLRDQLDDQPDLPKRPLLDLPGTLDTLIIQAFYLQQKRAYSDLVPLDQHSR